MSKFWKIVIVAALVAIVTAVVVIKQTGTKPGTDKAAPGKEATAGLPRLLDLGSTTCVPCKMMAPILEDLKKEHEGRLQVDFIDVNENAAAANEYGIKLIPTQIFFDVSGQERFRHEGFFSKEDILAKWKELGVDLGAGSANVGRTSGG